MSAKGDEHISFWMRAWKTAPPRVGVKLATKSVLYLWASLPTASSLLSLSHHFSRHGPVERSPIASLESHIPTFALHRYDESSNK
jgi:hypothetical protein